MEAKDGRKEKRRREKRRGEEKRGKRKEKEKKRRKGKNHPAQHSAHDRNKQPEKAHMRLLGCVCWPKSRPEAEQTNSRIKTAPLGSQNKTAYQLCV